MGRAGARWGRAAAAVTAAGAACVAAWAGAASTGSHARAGGAAPGSSSPPRPTTSTIAPAATPTPRPPVHPTIEIAVTGDLLVHQPVAARARRDARGRDGHDFRGMLAPVAPVLRGADLALCHAETPISADNRALSGYPRFWVPRELATAIRDAGYDGCSTASNHTLDQGVAGVRSTLDVLDAAGVGHSGSARTAAEGAGIRTYGVDGVRVAHLSYAYGFNRFQPPAGKEWLVNRIEIPRILADATRARRAGAQLVVVSVHWGVEYRSAPTAEQLAVAHALTASADVDVVVGHHAHVLQPIRTVNGKLVVFGLGNLLSAQSARAGLPAATQDGAVVLLRAQPTDDAVEAPHYRVSSYRAVLTVVEPGTYRVRPVLATLSDPRANAAQKRDARAALQRERKVDPAYAKAGWLPVAR